LFIQELASVPNQTETSREHQEMSEHESTS
jgi:hypothetical protein